MPRKISKYKLTEEQNRNIKLTSDKKEEIKEKYSTENYTLKDLAKMYNVSDTTIRRVVDDEYRERWLEYKKQYNKMHPRSKESLLKSARSTVKYKKDLYLKGELEGTIKRNVQREVDGMGILGEILLKDNGILTEKSFEELKSIMGDKFEVIVTTNTNLKIATQIGEIKDLDRRIREDIKEIRVNANDMTTLIELMGLD